MFAFTSLLLCFGFVVGQPEWFSECVGYGCGATNNYQHSSCVVDSLDEAVLKECLSEEYVHVTFSVSGTIIISSKITAPRGTIIDGSGQSVTFTGWDLFLTYESIVYRITFDTGFDDAISLRGDWVSPMGDIWIHHCSFTNYADGLVDITRGLSRVTISWCHFWNHDKVTIVSQDMEDTDTDNVTFHHNYYRECVQRMPRVRYAHVHVFNNVFDELVDYAVASTMFARILVENNSFLPSTIKNYRCTRVTPMGDDTDNGYLRHLGNSFNDDCAVEEYEPSNVPDPEYEYTAEPADQSLVDRVMAGAGNK